MARAIYGAREVALTREAGRDPGDLVYSNALVVCVGKDDREVARRAAAIGREVDELKANGLAGSPAEVVEKIGRYAGTVRFLFADLLVLAALALFPTRVVSLPGDQSAFTFTMFQGPEMPDELKSLLEQS